MTEAQSPDVERPKEWIVTDGQMQLLETIARQMKGLLPLSCGRLEEMRIQARPYDPDADSLEALNKFGYEVMHLLGDDERAIFVIKTWLEKKALDSKKTTRNGAP